MWQANLKHRSFLSPRLNRSIGRLELSILKKWKLKWYFKHSSCNVSIACSILTPLCFHFLWMVSHHRQLQHVLWKLGQIRQSTVLKERLWSFKLYSWKYFRQLASIFPSTFHRHWFLKNEKPRNVIENTFHGSHQLGPIEPLRIIQSFLFPCIWICLPKTIPATIPINLYNHNSNTVVHVSGWKVETKSNFKRFEFLNWKLYSWSFNQGIPCSQKLSLTNIQTGTNIYNFEGTKLHNCNWLGCILYFVCILCWNLSWVLCFYYDEILLPVHWFHCSQRAG